MNYYKRSNPVQSDQMSNMILGLLPVLLLLITIMVRLLLERHIARRLEAAGHRREETLEKHSDPPSDDIPYYYCQALQESRMQSDETLFVTGRIPRATLQQKTDADAPSFGHCTSYSSCSSASQLLHDTCSIFTECSQSSDTRLEGELVIGLQGIGLRIEERIPPDGQAIALKPTACTSGVVDTILLDTQLSKSRFRSFTGYYQYNNNNYSNALSKM